MIKIDGAGSVGRVSQRETHFAHERSMNQRGKSPGIDHELRRLSVQLAVDVEIPAFGDADRHVFPAAMIYSRHRAAGIGIDFHEQDLSFAIEHGLGREKNVGPENAVEFLLVKFAGGAGWRTEIDRDHRFVDQGQCAEAESMRDRDAIKAAVDFQARRKLGACRGGRSSRSACGVPRRSRSPERRNRRRAGPVCH